MSKLYRLLILILLAGVLLISSLAIAADSQGNVRIHYIRADQNFDGWGLHLWGDGYNGPPVAWNEPAPISGIDNYSCYWDISYAGSGSINFIIHNGGLKDPGPDQTFPNPQTVKEVYVVSGNTAIFQDLGDALTAAGINNLHVPPVADKSVRLHYCRPDNNYNGWGLHIWGSGYTGPAINWGAPAPPNGADTYGVYWDIPYTGSGNVSFIVHNGNTKDPGPDQVFDTSKKENWVYSGETSVYNSRLAAVQALSNRIERAVIVGLRKIEIRTRLLIKNPVVIKDGDREIQAVSTDNTSAPVYQVTIGEDLNFTKTYKVLIGNLTATTVLAPEVIDSKLASGEALGNFYTPQATTFKVWAPVATDVKLLLYAKNEDLNPERTIQMSKGEKGVWQADVPGDLDRKLYQYSVTNFGQPKLVLDPYARSMAAFNSEGPDKVGKGAIVNLQKTEPNDWKNDSYIKLKAQEDAIIYEMSVRDFTIASNSGIEPSLRGTYLGFIQKIPYLKNLGVTHVQLMPVQNWYFGNENNRAFENTHDSPANYNWGYDPHNFNTPEGWYATDPNDPYARILELKQLIRALHQANIGVILDVVYNHTAITDTFENIVPNYYYRRTPNGTFTAGSGCGNDTASEHAMWRKFMVDSTSYWVKEYHIDGFRFDLAALHDVTTMKNVAAALRSINPSIELHCEGWDLGTLPLNERYTKGGGSDADFQRACLKTEHAVSMFSDGIRDGILQPSYESPTEGTFIQGARNDEYKIRAGIIGNIVDYKTDMPIEKQSYHRFCDDPEESVNYSNCHDGQTLWDKLSLTLPKASEDERIKTNKLAFSIVMTSQGKAFFYGGEEMLRSKPDPDNENELGINWNSYDTGDLCNQIDWSREQKYQNVIDYYKGMIELRNKHKAFRMETADEIQSGLTFINENIDFLIAFKLVAPKGSDPWKRIIIIHNANRTAQTLKVSEVDPQWKVVVDGENAGVTPLKNTAVKLGQGNITVPPISTVVIYTNMPSKN